MAAQFKMDAFKPDDDGTWMNGPNDNDILTKENLLEVGVSEKLAAGLDGKTVGQFKETLTEHITNDDKLNAELVSLGKEVFASHNATGYEDNVVNAVITDLEHTAWDKFPKAVQGLVYDTDVSAVVLPKGQEDAPLPAALQVAEAAPVEEKTMYGLAVSPTDRAMQKLGL